MGRCLWQRSLFVLALLGAGCSTKPKVASNLTGEYDKIVVARAELPREDETIRPDPITSVRMGDGVVTAVQIYSVKPALQNSLVDGLRREARRVEGKIKGLVSINLHKSQDGRSVINYLQFENRGFYEKWRKGQDLNERAPALKAAYQSVDTQIYDVAYIQH